MSFYAFDGETKKPRIQSKINIIVQETILSRALGMTSCIINPSLRLSSI